MPNESPYNLWPDVDDRTLAQEMLNDAESKYWRVCSEYVGMLVQSRAKNIPQEHREDIAQQVMMRINKHLKNFKFQCSLKTWIFGIVRNCTIEAYRKSKHLETHLTRPNAVYGDERNDDDIIAATASLTPEEKFIVQEELQRALEALREYVNTHANPERNEQILKMFFFEKRSYEEIAKIVGCSAAVVGYIVRSAQAYGRKKWRS